MKKTCILLSILCLVYIVLLDTAVAQISQDGVAASIETTPVDSAPAAQEVVEDDDDMDFLDDDDEDEEEYSGIAEQQIADPFAFINKPFFSFNVFFYKQIARPVVRSWEWLMPKSARTGVNNVFRNLGYPLRASACVMQWRWHDAGAETIRFVSNSTGGLLGVFDIAAQGPKGIQPAYEDFGQAMGAWGIGHGFYLVFPFLGSTSLRDGIGWYGGTWVHPYFFVENLYTTTLLGVADKTNALSFKYGDVDTALDSSLDPYAAARHFYLQSRKQEVDE